MSTATHTLTVQQIERITHGHRDTLARLRRQHPSGQPLADDATIEPGDTVEVHDSAGLWTAEDIYAARHGGGYADPHHPPYVTVGRAYSVSPHVTRAESMDVHPDRLTLVRKGNADDDISAAMEAWMGAATPELAAARASYGLDIAGMEEIQRGRAAGVENSTLNRLYSRGWILFSPAIHLTLDGREALAEYGG